MFKSAIKTKFSDYSRVILFAKRLWRIPVVKDLFWFILLIILARVIWLGIKHIEPLTAFVHLNDIQAYLSSRYVQIIDFFLYENKRSYLIQDNFNFFFNDLNKTFCITPGCSALAHYFYFSFLILLFPFLKINYRLLAWLVGLVLLGISRILIIWLQLEVFLWDCHFYERYFHSDTKYIMLSLIFILWSVISKKQKTK